MGRLSTPNTPFDRTINRYREILDLALYEGYTFMTVQEFLSAGCPTKQVLILRHDLDFKPKTLWPILDAERAAGARSTIYVRVTANEYNPLSYHVLPHLLHAQRDGFEVGLHTSCVEFAAINDLNPLDVIQRETNVLRQFFNVTGVAPHRDWNYTHNSLPWLRDNWATISGTCGLTYEAYAPVLEASTVYVNDTFAPHLCWKTTPYDALATGNSVYFSTHAAWWYVDHPFEE